jgi:hypothetical protein
MPLSRMFIAGALSVLPACTNNLDCLIEQIEDGREDASFTGDEVVTACADFDGADVFCGYSGTVGPAGGNLEVAVELACYQESLAGALTKAEYNDDLSGQVDLHLDDLPGGSYCVVVPGETCPSVMKP